ncbi:MAG: hypothetical protein AB7R89_13860 [Dehalococcoidia bacterium]
MSDYDVMRRLLTAPPIAFHRELAVALGGVYEALMFQQLAYWSDKGSDPDGWIYKTTEELRQETTINRYQQDKARANLVRLGVIQAKRRGLPARMHYLIEWDALYRLLANPVCPPSTNSPPTASAPVCSPSTNLSADPEHALIGTENTSKTTQRTGRSALRQDTNTQKTIRVQTKEPPATAPDPRAMTPEQRLAHFEQQAAVERRLRAASGR